MNVSDPVEVGLARSHAFCVSAPVPKGQYETLAQLPSPEMVFAFALPPDLAQDLDFVLAERRAVRAQVVTRLLVPAIEALFDREVARRRG